MSQTRKPIFLFSYSKCQADFSILQGASERYHSSQVCFHPSLAEMALIQISTDPELSQDSKIFDLFIRSPFKARLQCVVRSQHKAHSSKLDHAIYLTGSFGPGFLSQS